MEAEAPPPDRSYITNNKINAEDVAEIRAILQVGTVRHADIAEAYGVSVPLIVKIASGDRWRGVKPMDLNKIRPEQAALLANTRPSPLLERAEPARSLLTELSRQGLGLVHMKRELALAGFVTRTGRQLSYSTIQAWLKALGLPQTIRR